MTSMHRLMGCSRRCGDEALLDTHLVLCWLMDDPHLPAAVVDRVQAPCAELFVS